MPSPPRLAEKLINWLCENGNFEDILGDLREQYDRNYKRRNVYYASKVYMWAVVCAFQPFILREKFRYNPRTFYSLSAIAFYRNANKSKLRFLLVSIGLSLGLVFTAFVFHYVSYELSYESVYPDYKTIYRIGSTKWATTSPVFSLKLEEEFEEINNVGRLLPIGPKVLQYKSIKIKDKYGHYANENLLKLFGATFLKGKTHDVLTEEYTIVITESLAKQIFSNIDPLGKVLTFGGKKSYTIRGVVKDFPTNSHIKASYFVSLPTMYKDLSRFFTTSTYTSRMYSYVHIPSNHDFDLLQKKIKDYTYVYWHNIDNSVTPQYIDQDRDYYELHPISKIHLTSHRERELGKNSNTLHIYILATLAMIILVLASINFINHLITQVLRRGKELNTRKALGANSFQLAAQFILEFLLALIFIGACALIISSLVHPIYNQLSAVQLTQNVVFTMNFLKIVICILFTIFIAANTLLIPVLNQFTSKHPSNIFTLPKSKLNFLGKIPLMTQFTVSLILILFSFAALKQMSFIEKSNLGFETDGFLIVGFNGDYIKDLNANFDKARPLLESYSAIESVSRVSATIGNRFGQDRIRNEKNDSARTELSMRFICTDHSFLPSLNISFINGNNFTGNSNEVIINETAAKMIAASKIGENIYSRLFGDMKIIGIVKDFNYASLHNKVDPLIIVCRPELSNQLLVKINGDNNYRTMRFIEKNLNTLLPDATMEFTYLKDSFNKQYQADNNLIRVAILFFVVTLVMLFTCIYNLINYIFESRGKEIGIRRVLGANHSQIISLLSKPILIVLLIASATAIPLGLLLTEYWLSLFEYKIEATWIYLLIAAGVSFVLFLFIIVVNFSWKLKARTIQKLFSQ